MNVLNSNVGRFVIVISIVLFTWLVLNHPLVLFGIVIGVCLIFAILIYSERRTKRENCSLCGSNKTEIEYNDQTYLPVFNCLSCGVTSSFDKIEIGDTVLFEYDGVGYLDKVVHIQDEGFTLLLECGITVLKMDSRKVSNLPKNIERYKFVRGVDDHDF